MENFKQRSSTKFNTSLNLIQKVLIHVNDAITSDNPIGKLLVFPPWQEFNSIPHPQLRCLTCLIQLRALPKAGVWGWLHLSGPLTRITSTKIVGIENQAWTKVGEPSGAEDRLWVNMHVIKLPRLLQLLLHLQQAHWLGLQ